MFPLKPPIRGPHNSRGRCFHSSHWLEVQIAVERDVSITTPARGPHPSRVKCFPHNHRLEVQTQVELDFFFTTTG
ncbi:hypothetical protein RRG08_019731 [Elysia crispata]|uniref:Uncharacterized protein n=1 Tax=Elysia crispata TaxID=231223 RepID=A0AAE0Y558_9GAST|nr:hypothetical protein RRG08_019731 [Elysia crispata]